MFIKSALFFTSTTLLLGAALPAYGMKEEGNEENLKITRSSASSSPKVDIKKLNLTVAQPEGNNLPCPHKSFLTGWDHKGVISTILYNSPVEQDSSVKNYINIINDHLVFGKKNEFSLFYNKEKNETHFFPIGVEEKLAIFKIIHKDKDVFLEYENGKYQELKLDRKTYSCSRKYYYSSTRKNELSPTQQMESLNHLWKPENQEKTIYSMRYENKLRYLSFIVDDKLYFLHSNKKLKGQFTPIFYTYEPLSDHRLLDKQEGESEGVWTFAYENKVFSFSEKTTNYESCCYQISCDLKDIDLKIDNFSPQTDKNSQFILYGDNESDVIKSVKKFNNHPIAELEKIMAPGNTSRYGSIAGFLGTNQKLLDIMVEDNDYVNNELGLTHRQLADPLKRIEAAHSYKNPCISIGTPFLFHENIYMLAVAQTMGSQLSPFYDEGSASKVLILYNLSIGKLLAFSPLVIHMIEKYGFYEGNTSFRVDPKNIVSVFPWLTSKK